MIKYSKNIYLFSKQEKVKIILIKLLDVFFLAIVDDNLN